MIDAVPSEIAEISKTWLRWTPSDYPFRRQIAELAVFVGKATFEKRKACPYARDEQDGLKYSAALLAALEYPDEVADLALKACGRIVPEDVINGKVGDYRKPGSKTTVHHVGFSVPAEVPEPWLDGPKNRVDDAFQKICLTTDSLTPLMRIRPQIVEEIILALVIELRKAQSGYDDYHWSDKDIGLHHLHHEFYPRCWYKGPFINILRCNQEYGLDTIIRLVDFATERLIEVRPKENNITIETIFNNKPKKYCGSVKIYNWYRGDPWCADVITSALMGLEKYFYECIDKNQNISKILEKMLSQANSVAFLGLAGEIGRYKPELFIEALKPLLTVPELYLFEDRCTYLNSGNSIIVSPQPSERKVMYEWENMPHRKIQLVNIAIHLFWNANSLENLFVSFKQSLDRRFEKNSDEGEVLEKIRRLSTYFDKNNWEMTKTADGKAGWQYRKPKQLQEEDEATLDQIQQKQVVLTFPMCCRQLLDKEKNLETNRIESFWQQINQISQFKFSEDDSRIKIVDGVIGGVAVLIKCHYEWLKDHPEYLARCTAWIFDVMKNPPPRGKYDLSYSAGNISWDSFISEIAPILWAEAPESKQWRQLIAELVCLRHYEAMNLLMTSAYRLRFKIGRSFDQLVYLVLLHAAFGNRLQFEFKPTTKEELEAHKKIMKKTATYKKQFVKNSLGHNTSTWGIDIASKAQLIPYQPQRRNVISIGGNHRNVEPNDGQSFFRKRPKVDLELLASSFKDIFSIEDAQNESEQVSFLQFWEQILICRLSFNRLYDKDSIVVRTEEHDGDPGWESDNPILQAVAKFVSRAKEPHIVKRLWKPIVDLGPSDHDFVDSFLEWFFFYGFEFDCTENFMNIWKEMFSEVCSSDCWSPDKFPKQWHNIKEIWESLLIIKDHTIHKFSNNESHPKAIYEMKDYYYRWAQDNLLRNGFSTRYYLEFLKRPIAKLLRLDSVIWLIDAANSQKIWWEGEKDMVESLAEYLSFLWENHKADLKNNKSLNNKYKELLQLLADKQYSMAIDLQVRIMEEKS